MKLDRAGVRADLPRGWEGSIRGRKHAGHPRGNNRKAAQETELAMTHLGSFPLPADRGDFGSGAVERMLAGDAFLALLEYEPEAAETALFARRGLPRRLQPGDFDPASLQRTLAGQTGTQVFFNEAGRAFCLYVVLGAASGRAKVVPRVNRALEAITIGRR